MILQPIFSDSILLQSERKGLLINVDTKILAKTLMPRLEQVFSKLTHKVQVGLSKKAWFK